jgi:hypothetical protein
MREKSFLFALLMLACHVTFCQQQTRLNHDWEFLKQDVGGIW